MICHYTTPEMFLFTATKFKQKLNTQNMNTATEKHIISMVVDGGRAYFVQPRHSNQWVQRKAQPWAGLDKG